MLKQIYNRQAFNKFKKMVKIQGGDTSYLENTEKFLNQVSDYSYSLSRKNIYNESSFITCEQ